MMAEIMVNDLERAGAAPLVLLASHVPWSHQWQTPQYVAELLARKADVLLSSRPSHGSPRHLIFIVSRTSAKSAPQPRIWALTPPALPFGRFSWVRMRSERHPAGGWSAAPYANSRHEGFSSGFALPVTGCSAPAISEDACVYHGMDLLLLDRDAEAAKMLAGEADLVLGSVTPSPTT